MQTDPHEPLSNPQAQATGKLLTAGEVAQRLDVGVHWVWAQARQGRIPHVKLGRYRRFRAETIDEWLAELEQNVSR